MFSRHVTRHLVAYCHGALPAHLAGRVVHHLEQCVRCRTECEEIRLGLQSVSSLPRAVAPTSLWHKIEAALDQPSVAHPGPLASLAGAWRDRRGRRIALAAALIVAVALGLTWQRRHAIAVAYQVEDAVQRPGGAKPAIRGAGRLRVGQWLITNASSQARLDLAEMGEVNVQPNSRVGLLPSPTRERRLSLAHGTLEAFISAPPRLFFVDTPSALAVDLGCAYTLHVDRQSGRGLLRVSLGYVAFEWPGREAIVPMGAACETRPGFGPGTPYFETAAPALRNALQRFDFERGGTPMLQIVLAEAGRRDAFTLWHLLSRVAPADRLRVYQRLAFLLPPPSYLTRDAILNLDPASLDEWKNEIEDSWWE